jgi:hypothetical protein
MELTFHNSNVILELVPSTVICSAELRCWHKCYSNKTTLLLGWSHCYKNYHHHNLVDRYKIYISQMKMDLLLLRRCFLSTLHYHCQDFYPTWLYIYIYKLHGGCIIRSRNCLPFASTRVRHRLLAYRFSFCVVLLYVLMFWVSCCDPLRFPHKTMFGSSLPQLFVGGPMSYLR